MASGCPIAVSREASLPEICGDAAFYVNPLEIDDIKRGMTQILTNVQLQKDLVAEGLERPRRMFTWQKSAENQRRTLKEIYERRG